jgi:hypothetical protein
MGSASKNCMHDCILMPFVEAWGPFVEAWGPQHRGGGTLKVVE